MKQKISDLETANDNFKRERMQWETKDLQQERKISDLEEKCLANEARALKAEKAHAELTVAYKKVKEDLTFSLAAFKSMKTDLEHTIERDDDVDQKLTHFQDYLKAMKEEAYRDAEQVANLHTELKIRMEDFKNKIRMEDFKNKISEKFDLRYHHT